jgi:Protein of unknown function (DUF2917)
MENLMATQTALFSQQSSLDQSLPGCWKLGAGRAVTLKPREDGVLRIAHCGLWVTLEGPHSGPADHWGDHFLSAGQELTVQAGQHVVFESWGNHAEAPAYFTWDPMPAVVRRPVRVMSQWQAAVVQPLADLRLALGLGAGAVGRLGLGVAGFALDLAFGRGRAGLRSAAAFNAQSNACRAH